MARTRSIRTRLLLALLTMTLLTLAVSTLLSAALDLRLMRASALRDLEILAAVVGENCTSALVFDSPDTAARHLATLAAERQVQRAELLDAAGRRFALWQQPAGGPAAGPAVAVRHELHLDGAPLGAIVLQARLGELHRQVLHYLWLSALLALATLVVALLVALRLQRRIAAPLSSLAETARQVSAQQDLSLRMPPHGRVAELDDLIDAFNSMLAGLESREGRIQQQAAALHTANTKLRALAVDLSLLEQSEKARLAEQLHDSPMQKLALALLQLENGLAEPDAEGRQLTDSGLTLLREAIGELRTLQFELSPPVLAQSGLPAALQWLAKRMGERAGLPIAVHLPAAGEGIDLSRTQSVTLFQCARELVYNLVKHAEASRGRIELTWDAARVALEVADDGVGFAHTMDTTAASATPHPGQPAPVSSPAAGGFGLYSIRERVALLDGRLRIHTGPHGTRVSIHLPRDSGAGSTT
ncbi:CHASE sensor domain-containing protein [uncultured Thiohalocapsa sp.]|uniref:CHASE sensor domain-containing protein n=1 Tax=uncultured Thiohalocapsa sp. TaxID=768990 RepID=UPI0025DEFEDD|nr:CHASE sensor domain-containing protein [uncultured Thiohalocapsa sp.]